MTPPRPCPNSSLLSAFTFDSFTHFNLVFAVMVVSQGPDVEIFVMGHVVKGGVQEGPAGQLGACE
jgi:hypothetical protein